MRKHCSSVRQLSSPGRADRSELMLCVATIGISRACRDRANVRSSPVGSVSPTVANAWYSSQTNSRSRQTRSGCALICGMRCSTARWKSSFSITPRMRARPGFIATGKFSASTLPASSSVSSGSSGRGSPGGERAHVGAPRRTERAVDGRVVVEQREEHDDAFDDGRPQPRVEPTPAVHVPALHRLELVLPCGPARALRPSRTVKATLLAVEVGLQLARRTGAPCGPRLPRTSASTSAASRAGGSPRVDISRHVRRLRRARLQRRMSRSICESSRM